MFTSRAEYRILLRQDDADARLTMKSHAFGLATTERAQWWKEKEESINNLLHFCENRTIKPSEINSALEATGNTPLRFGTKLSELIARPQLNMDMLCNMVPELRAEIERLPNRKAEISEAVEINIKYKGYVERERQAAEKMHRLEDIKIRGRFNYAELHEISTEGRQKLERINPETLAQASRIPGVSPSDINVLLVLLHR